MKKYLLALIVLAFSSSAVLAEGEGKGQMDPAKRQEMFTKMKQMKSEGLQARISIMQTALSCVNAATDHDQIKACSQKEHQAMKALHDQHKSKMHEMHPEGRKGGYMKREGGDRPKTGN